MKRVIYRFPEKFCNDIDYIKKLVNLIQNKQNEIFNGKAVEELTYYTMLNYDAEVVLVDKSTYYEKFVYNIKRKR